MQRLQVSTVKSTPRGSESWSRAAGPGTGSSFAWAPRDSPVWEVSEPALAPRPVPLAGGWAAPTSAPPARPWRFHPSSPRAWPWEGVLRPQGIKGQLYFRVGLSGESQGGAEPNPARWCDRSAFGPFIHSTAVSGTPTMCGARASSAGLAPPLQPLAGTLATRPAGKVAPMNSPLAGSPYIPGLVSSGECGQAPLLLEERESSHQLKRGENLEIHKGFRRGVKIKARGSHWP